DHSERRSNRNQSAHKPGAESHEKGPCWQTWHPRCAHQGEVGKATPSKKAPKARKKANKPAARQGSKTAQILELLKRPGGATLHPLMAATEWQPHSVRGFISGTLGKKLGLTVESAKGEDGARTYSLKA